MKFTARMIPYFLLALLAAGCADIRPGPLAAIQPAAALEQPHVGRVYLFRGFIGVFSTGMNQLGDQLNAEGVQTTVFQSDQWTTIADTIADRYASADNREPFVLVGHSYGADNILRLAQKLNDKGVKVDLLITLDPVTPPKVSANVVKCVNLYQSNGALDKLPWLRGIPLEADKNAENVVLLNENIRDNRKDLLEPGLNHFNIEKKEKIHAEIIKQVLEVCTTRDVWTARQQQSHSASVFTGMSSADTTPHYLNRSAPDAVPSSTPPVDPDRVSAEHAGVE